jgi:Phage integrase family
MRGPNDFRHTFSTWLEDAGIPARVIDELMGHQRSRHGELDGGSRIGARYRHTTDQMAARVVDAIEARLQMVLRAGEEATRAEPSRKSFRVFETRWRAGGAVRSISTHPQGRPCGRPPQAVVLGRYKEVQRRNYGLETLEAKHKEGWMEGRAMCDPRQAWCSRSLEGHMLLNPTSLAKLLRSPRPGPRTMRLDTNHLSSAAEGRLLTHRHG